MRQKKNKFKKSLAILLVILVVLSSIKFLIFKPKLAFADSTLGFNEGYGTTVSDNNSNITGTITNAVWKQEELCKVGKCLYFDGTGDYVSFGDDADLDFAAASNFTIEGWFRTPDITSGTRVLVSKYNGSTGTDGGYKVYIDSNGYLIFGIDDDSTSFPEDSASTSTTAFDDNKWHYFAAVKTGTTSITLYVDGIQYQTDSSISSTGTLANTDTYYVGIDGDGSSNGFSGFLDEITIHNTARSVAEIKTDMSGQTPSRGTTAYFGSDQSHLSDGLVGYWKMDETTANGCGTDDSCDSSGNANNLAWNGNATTATGKFGSGVTLDGSGDYLTDTIGTSLSNSSFTIASWVYQTSAATQTFFRLGSSFSNNTVLHIRAYSDGTILCGFYFNDLSTSSGIFHSGGWHHIACTYDKNSNSRTIYYDGNKVASDTSTSAFTGNTDLLLGNISGLEEWNGKIDETRIYNKALSPSEISQVYSYSAGPIAYWKLDENSGTSASDSSNNSNSGTLTNGPVWNIAKNNSGVLFDGSDDNITITRQTSIQNIGSNGTISAWIKPSAVDTSLRTLFDLSSSGINGIILFSNDTSGLINFQYGTGASSVNLNSATAPVANTWYYVTATWDSVSGGKLYINGVLASSSSTVPSITVGAGTSYIGTQGAFPTRTHKGVIDDLKIYNYARSSSQVIEDMNGGHTAPGSPVGSSVAKWKLDEGYGTTAHDNSLNANDLTLSTASWTNDAKFGKAFNGLTNVRMSRTDDADLDFAASDDFSFSFWFKSDSATNPSANEYLLEKGGNITTDAIGYAIYTSAASDGLICFGIDDDSTSFPEDQTCSSSDLYDNTWHHIVAKKTGTTRLDLYVDGKPTGTPDTSISATGTLENSATFYIGDTNGTDGTDEFLGDIDEIQVFRSALAEDQIKALFNNASDVSMGALSTDSSNNPSNSDLNSYCPPGQGSTCTGPVAEWKLDENVGTTAQDSSGNANTGTITAGTGGYISGKLGSAYRFDGADTVVNAGSGSTLDAMSAITAEAWIYPKSEGENTNTWFINKASSGTTSPSSGWSLSFDNSGTNALRFAIDWSVSHVERIANDSTVTLNQWQHVAVTWDGSNTCTNIHIYINGIEPAYQGCGTPAGGSRVSDASANLYFGSNYNSSRTLDGYMDDVRVYNYVRTPAQIAWDMNHGAPVGWWKLDENTGTTANDSSGNSTAGTLTNSPSWVTGKFNQAVSFAGSNQQILIADDPDFDFADDESMSITGWFKHSTASAQEIILSKYAAAGYKVIMESDGDITCGLDYDSTWTPTDSATSTLATYDDGSWHHFACVKNGATSLSLYIDGNLITTDSSITATNTLTNADPVYLGIDADGLSNDYTGSLDDIRIYRYPLTVQQIKTIMSNGSAVKY